MQLLGFLAIMVPPVEAGLPAVVRTSESSMRLVLLIALGAMYLVIWILSLQSPQQRSSHRAHHADPPARARGRWMG